MKIKQRLLQYPELRLIFFNFPCILYDTALSNSLLQHIRHFCNKYRAYIQDMQIHHHELSSYNCLFFRPQKCILIKIFLHHQYSYEGLIQEHIKCIGLYPKNLNIIRIFSLHTDLCGKFRFQDNIRDHKLHILHSNFLLYNFVQWLNYTCLVHWQYIPKHIPCTYFDLDKIHSFRSFSKRQLCKFPNNQDMKPYSLSKHGHHIWCKKDHHLGIIRDLIALSP